MNPDDRIKFMVAIGIAFVLFMIGSCIYERPYSQTKETIHNALAKLEKLDNPPERLTLGETDAWGNPLVFYYSAEKTALSYKVVSPGPDGKEGTADDISETYVDYNLSRMAGKWTAEKAREFVKGVKDGLKTESKYEKAEQAQKQEAEAK